MRQTSIEIYHQIRENGLLSKLRLEVYDCLFKHGPLTQTECYKLMDSPISSITPRFAELLDRGVIYEAGIRPCKFTGVNCIEWDVNDKLPVDPPKRERNKEKIQRLEEEIEFLKAELHHARSLVPTQLLLPFDTKNLS